MPITIDEVKALGEPPLRCVVGEDWLLERIPNGELRIVLWLNTMHHFLADSSVRTLEV